MTKNNIAILILIVGFTALIGYFVGKSLLGGSQLKPVSVESTRPISAEVVKPSSEVFNSNAINPTTTITISQSNSTLFGN